jgi:preprotein translocase subunit YajC
LSALDKFIASSFMLAPVITIHEASFLKQQQQQQRQQQKQQQLSFNQ